LDQTITLPASAALNGTATDADGPSALTLTWSKVTGPGTVTFGNSHAEDTQASFSAAGIYVLRLTGNDGATSKTDDVQITVNAASSGSSLSRAVAASSDDAEERAGSMSLTSSDLELVYDGGIQKVGMRFTSITIPRNATVTRAWIQFTADESQSEATALTIRAQNADQAATFTTSSNNITDRTLTSASASWSPSAWNSSDGAGTAQRTPDFAAVVQAVVNRSGWVSGNALAIIITGTGHRTAHAQDNGSGAAVLHVEYTP
jgi:hypothetical protein